MRLSPIHICCVIYMIVGVVYGELLESIGTDLDPNLIKPSDIQIEQRRIFRNKASDGK
jgi:ABC-type enterochelin transport system permease subunit